MKNGVIMEFRLMEIGNIVKFRTPKTDAIVEGYTMKVGTTFESSLTKTRLKTQCGLRQSQGLRHENQTDVGM